MNYKKKILVADDDPSMIQVLTDKLAGEGFIVVVASNGQECLELAEKQKPDLMLLDLMMPAMNGMEVLEKIRAMDEWGKTIPVIVITNIDPDESVVRRITKAKPYFFYSKGIFNLDEMAIKIKEALDI